MSEGPFTDPAIKAKELGLIVVEPKEDELFVDIDSEDDLNWMHEALSLLCDFDINLVIKKIIPSKTAGCFHAYIDCSDWQPVISREQRVFLQVLLGSDIKRELLAFVGIHKACPFPVTIFFEKSEN